MVKNRSASGDETVDKLADRAVTIRVRILQMINSAPTDHPGHHGGSLSSADIIAVLYFGVMNIDPEKPALPLSHPFIYSIYLAKLLGSFITLGEANDTWALNEGVLSEEAFLELTYSNHREWEGMLFNALSKTKKGLVTCVFETTDSIQHMFWRYLDENHPALERSQAEMSAKVIEELYQKMRRK